MVSWPDQCSLGLSVILASTLTSATPTHTFMHMCPATVRSWRVVSAAIESPGQQVDKGDTAGGMPGEGRRVSGWRWGEGWLLENVDRRWEGAGGCRGWGVGQADLGLCTVVRWGAKATGREGGVWSGRIKAATRWLMTKHTDTQGTPADPCEPSAETAAPASLEWSLSQHFWLMSDSFPTTNYGNNAARDEVHKSAAALHSALIPHNKASSALVGKASFSHLACWSCWKWKLILYNQRLDVFKSNPQNKYF